MDQGAEPQLAAPAGWSVLHPDDPFNRKNGPFFIADPFEATETEPARIGFRVGAHNCSFAGICHGGVIASVLDIALGQSIQRACGAAHTPTMSLAIDFVRRADVGEWLESRVRILKMTRSVAFCDTLLVGPNGNV